MNAQVGIYFVCGVVRRLPEPFNPSGKGKLRFSDPQKEDRLPLGFDPRAEWIEVRSGDDVILEAAFPE